ncbi:hypothetical protein PORY_000099 [Pneumocystis oryctolagi]|uniref:Uncharacterized protein n=1 Tax=Pneumocystis oryctolagi TaxID=42067 RepID=A0ACB7CEL9_9ASCO|nr:hypothetical protein PORY_000099 [Pneumocystis oryctolagi]
MEDSNKFCSFSECGLITVFHQDTFRQKSTDNCIHLETRIDLDKIRRSLYSGKKDQRSCCCGFFCIGLDEDHIVKHAHQEPTHCLFVNIKNTIILCCVCKSEFSFQDNMSLEIKEVQKLFRRKFCGYQKVKNEKKSVKGTCRSFKYKSLVPGLQNLGNTCYFNSVCIVYHWIVLLVFNKYFKVMQVLAASLPLHDVICIKPFFDPFSTQVKGTGSLIIAFIEYLNTVYSCMSENTIFKPQKLFSQIQKKHKQFTPSKQQDAHELLRYFLDSLSMEESSNVFTKNVPEKLSKCKQKTQGESDLSCMLDTRCENINGTNNDALNKNTTFIDKLFGGRLASVVVCNGCKSVSTSYEKFQDISLSIKTSDTCNTKANNKYNFSKKTRKKKSASNNLFNCLETSCSKLNDCLERISDEKSPSAELENISETCLFFKELSVDSLEENASDSSKHIYMNSDAVETVKAESEYIDLLLFERNNINEKKNSWNLEDSLRLFTSVEVLENENGYACEECAKRLCSNTKNKVCKSSQASQRGFRLSNVKSSKSCIVSLSDDSSEHSFSTKTLASDFCSQSSESHIFVSHMPNSDHQAKQTSHTSSDGFTNTSFLNSEYPSSGVSDQKFVLSSAFKRFLIDLPLPPILILHLKRFQQSIGRFRSSFKKIDTFVDFPETLDLTDYVTPRLRSGPGLSYMLTGVIVHIGTLTHGHYASYILTHKIQPLDESASGTLIESNSLNSLNSPNISQRPLRQWVFANDTLTRPATWDEVRQSAGYLFVYEQIRDIPGNCDREELFFKFMWMCDSQELSNKDVSLETGRLSVYILWEIECGYLGPQFLKADLLHIQQMQACMEKRLEYVNKDKSDDFSNEKSENVTDDIVLSLKIKSYYENIDQETDYEESDVIEDSKGNMENSSKIDRYGFFSSFQKLPKQKNKIISQFKSIEFRNKFIRKKKRIILDVPLDLCFHKLLNQDNIVWYKEGYDVSKKEINRIEKWRSMAIISRIDGNTEYTFSDTKKLAKRVFKGIPDSWRSAAWYSFLSCSAKKNGSKYTDSELKMKYHEFLALPYSHDFQINLDVPRTISGHVFFQRQYRDGQRLLFRVLHALSLFYPEIGYVQGMASLVATFLCYYDEEYAFIMSVRLWEERGILSIFSDSFNNLFSCFNELKSKLLKTKVGKKLLSLGIDVSVFSTKWYLTLFSHSLSFCTQLRIWDVFIWYHSDEKDRFEILHLTAMAIIWGMKDMLIKADFEMAMKLLTSRIHVVDDDALMELIESQWKSMKKGWASSGPHPTKHPRCRIPKLKPIPEGIMLQTESNSQLFYNPPASPPDYRITPYSFLPETVKKLSEKSVFHGKLPPPLSPIKKKKYHLTDDDIKQIKLLRESGMSRCNIAKKFNASQLFVGIVAPLSKEKLQEIEQKRQEIRKQWSDSKKEAMMNRMKRRKLWGKEYQL